MIEAWAVPDVRRAEQTLMAELPSGELMQRAARGIAEVLLERTASSPGGTVVVLAGGGDNGGDALYAAGLVAPLTDWRVAAITVTASSHAEALAAARASGVRIYPGSPEDVDAVSGEVEAAADFLRDADIVLDGLLGIGGRPGLPASMARWVDMIPARTHVVAVDLPSGQDPSGRSGTRAAVVASETITLGVAKPVHLLPATEAAVGRLRIVDIGLRRADLGEPLVRRMTQEDVRSWWPVPGASDHKYSRGVVGVVAGSAHFPGAGILCVTAAAEAGAGMIRYVAPSPATDAVVRAVPEAVPGQGRVQAWVLGPGVPPDDEEQGPAITSALASDDPCVVDAGALAHFTKRRQAPTLITPHAGELVRLLGAWEAAYEGLTRHEVEANPSQWARQAAELTGATVLLKGATTVVADAEVPWVLTQADAPAWLATAGSGDVLAGLCGVLLAAGKPACEAGAVAALVHGVAGDQTNPGGPVRALRVAQSLAPTVAQLLRPE